MSDKAKETKDAPKGEAAAEGDAAAPKKKGRGKLFIILAVVLVLLGGGGAGAFFMLRKPAPAEGEAAAADAPKEHAANGIVNFEPFVVNLADQGKRRFLRITVRLLVAEEEQAKHVEESQVLQARLRADILELLTEQTSETVASSEGKAELKKHITEKAHHILEHEKIEVADVLFSDLVIQY